MKRFEELMNQFNSLSENEKDFISWCVTERLIEQYKTEMKRKSGDVYYQMYLSDAVNALQKVNDALAYKVF
jgi:hypothetical protein